MTHVKYTAFAFVAAALVAAALTAPAALAGQQPTIALQHIGSPDPRDTASTSASSPTALTYLASPDTRDAADIAAASGGTALQYLASPDPRDTASTVVTIVGPGGFDWGDAGIGAAIAFGFAVLLCGGALVALRRRAHTGSDGPATTTAL